MVVEEQLVFMAEIKGVPRKEAARRLPPWLERLGLATWGKRKMNELSKGMQQKAQFIATVLHEPPVAEWSSQDSVDTPVPELVSGFELFRADTAEMAVSA